MEILFLLEISKEYGRHRFIHISGDMICCFLTRDNVYKYISNKEINLTPHSIAAGEENIYFSTPRFKFIEIDKIDTRKSLDTNGSSVDPIDYHVSNCGKDSFKKMRTYKFHSNCES